LVGVISLRDLIVAEPSTPVAELMSRKVKSVPARLDQEQAARMLSQYDFVALPVVSDDGKMVGVITVDDILDIIQEEATEDIQRLGGSQPLESPYLHAGFWSIFRKRIGWLALFFIAGTLTSNILSHYESMLTSMVALSFFIPLLIGTGGNAGAQTSTLVIRAMAMGEITTKDTLKVIGREILLGLALGLALAVITFIRAATLGGPSSLGLTVAAAVIAVVAFSSSIGALMPIIGKRLGLDPAVFSAPMITTLVDACGLIIYFQFARLMLGLH
ncbi:MAG TPA: magnesium transporter, partial [Bacillota bacterium]|nr:magnesium transporter [Bacillota bacterium]